MLFFVMHTKLDPTGLNWFELTTANQVGTDGPKLMLMQDLVVDCQDLKVALLLRKPVKFRCAAIKA